MATALQHDLDHRVGAERAVQLVELLTAGGVYRDGHAQVLAALAFAQFDGAGVKRRVELLRDAGDGMYQAIHLGAHDLDRKFAGVFNQGLGACCSGLAVG